MIKDIYIIGSSGFAKEVAFLIESINKIKEEWNILGYIGLPDSVGKYNGTYKVIATENDLAHKNENIFLAIGTGDPHLNSKIINTLKNNKNFVFPNIIHPNVNADWDNIQIGEGNVICSSNQFTTDINIGSFNIFNLSCTIGHDTVIGNYNVINPSSNISGGVRIQNKNLFGTGCQILQDLVVSDSNIIGAGSVVNKNIKEQGVYVGIPARKLK